MHIHERLCENDFELLDRPTNHENLILFREMFFNIEMIFTFSLHFLSSGAQNMDFSHSLTPL